ncbi:MAG: hypothetical protein QNJ33_20585 [Crocosphaera sp.]|nr:hypothetical protein [Crocosphaera sp.]
MKVIADICVIPMGVGVSVSEYVAVCKTIFTEANLNPQRRWIWNVRFDESES